MIILLLVGCAWVSVCVYEWLNDWLEIENKKWKRIKNRIKRSLRRNRLGGDDMCTAAASWDRLIRS